MPQPAATHIAVMTARPDEDRLVIPVPPPTDLPLLAPPLVPIEEELPLLPTSPPVPLPPPATDVVAAAIVASQLQQQQHRTTAATRSYNDLDFTRYCLYFGGLMFFQKAIQQPMMIALGRKQACHVCGSQSTMQILRDIWRNEGKRRVFTLGAPALLFGSVSANVVCAGLMEYARTEMPFGESSATTPPSSLAQVVTDCIAGTGGDIVSTFLTIPTQVVANRQITANTETMRQQQAAAASRTKGSQPFYAHPSIRQTCSVMMQEGRGIRPFFAGLGSTLIIECSMTGLWFAGYNWLKRAIYPYLPFLIPQCLQDAKWVPDSFRSTEDNLIANSIASLVSSGIAAVAFNPFYVVRTVVQVTPGANFWSVTKKIYGETGMRGLYKGSILNMTVGCVDGLLLTVCYEYARLWADKTKLHDDEQPDTKAAAENH